MTETTDLPIESKIFVKDHLTDFEKLLLARQLIKTLKQRLNDFNADEKIKSLNLELGKANSYIQELESKLKTLEKLTLLNKEENKQIKTKVKASELYKQQQNKINSLEKEIHKLRKDKDILIYEVLKLKNVKG